jgi:pyruvate formate lyase activating enzyme
LTTKSADPAKKRHVLSIARMTVHNGPGIRTLILLKGCPLRCIWCSTPESWKETPEIAFYPHQCILCNDCIPVCPKNAIATGDRAVVIDRESCDNCGRCVDVCNTEALRLLGQQYTADELVHEVMKDEIVHKHSGGGATVSGGEPLLEPEFAAELLRALKENGINTGADTCGFVPRKNIEVVLPYVDFFLWDIKHMDDDTHRKLTGVSNRVILDNLCFASGNNIPVYLKVPVIPGCNDSEENLRAVCDFAGDLHSLVEINLLPLHHLGKARYAALGREYPIDGIPFIKDDVLTEMKRLAESYGLKCSIIG